jgi:hypothetical protein
MSTVARLFLLGLLVWGGVLHAQAPQPNRAQQQQYTAFTQTGRAPDISATTSSLDEALGSLGPVTAVFNQGPSWAYIALNKVSTSVTVATGLPVPPGSCVFLNSQDMAHIAAISAGTSLLQVSVGWGNYGSCGGPANSSVNQNVTQGTSPWVVSNPGTFGVQATQSGSWNVGITGALPAFASTPTFNLGNTLGSTGSDASANKPTLPNVGANFGGSGPYANYVLITTLAASPTRNNVDIENNSGAQIAIIRDDGTAVGGAAPVNASVFALAGGASAGSQGGAWSSMTFKGRIQVYALSSGAQVAVLVE